jgi:hypothetical protein
MGNRCSRFLDSDRLAIETPPMDEVVLIAGAGDLVIADLAAFLCRQEHRRVAVASTPEMCERLKGFAEVYPLENLSKADLFPHSVILFLNPCGPAQELPLLDEVVEILRHKRPTCVCVVSSFRVHFGDHRAIEAETRVLEKLRSFSVSTVVFRPSHVLSLRSRPRAWLKALSFLYPLVPRRWKSCFVDGDELFGAIEQEIGRRRSAKRALYTLLGPNRAWQDVLALHTDGNALQRCLAGAATVLSWLGVGWMIGILVGVVLRLLGSWRHWKFDTLHPTSAAELLAVYNKYNHRHVKVVGYNNGVVHFGQHFPDKTVVATVGCSKVARVNCRLATFDSGVTVRQGIDVLGRVGKEFYVVPNYSYVSLGTSFFIPIHGSASEYSTMGDTIEKALLYDPIQDRFVAARRSNRAFGDYMYDLGRPALLLRLHMRVKDKSAYYMSKSRVEAASAEQVLEVLRDQHASNVEIRKTRAADTGIDIYRYYTDAAAANGEALPFPKDSLGRLWDKLEANRLSSVLFHGLSRWLIHHVELFFCEDEFALFWKTHGSLPLMKIQLRYIKRDGLPHSPFQHHDCISADLGMLKKHKRTFDTYLKENFRAVQLNPGKHSM